MTDIKRVVLIVMDGCGVGALPDAELYGDAFSDTLGHIKEKIPSLELPNLLKLGLGRLHPSFSMEDPPVVEGFYGKMSELSCGKDTATGHWELMGVVTDKPFKTFPQGFPNDIIEMFSKRTSRGVIGNIPASGTEIIETFGELQQQTGNWIVYTSADSVFQIAAHEDVIPLEELYNACEIAYDIVVPYGISRVIARPFLGSKGSFYRTANRHDYTVPPPTPTLLSLLTDNDVPVFGIGKIRDIYANQGVTHHLKASSNDEIAKQLFTAMDLCSYGLIFANFVDFDMLYGHRRNIDGFAKALVDFDKYLEKVLLQLKEGDLLMITADHGNDPTMQGTDHCREYVPIFVYNPLNKKGGSLGIRTSFADVGQTIATALHVKGKNIGISFLNEVQK